MMKPQPSIQPEPLFQVVEMPLLELRGHTYDDHDEVIPNLIETMNHCGCWLLEQRLLSPTHTELNFELQLRSVFELYSALLATGIQLSRDSHTRMKSLCTVRDHNPHRAKRRRILTVRLELIFLALDDDDAAADLARTAMGLA
ncbi:MAG: hypothetical protein WBY53_12080 [Acidobacteriaceae bacterium]